MGVQRCGSLKATLSGIGKSQGLCCGSAGNVRSSALCAFALTNYDNFPIP
jgi:hypothetical protein